MNKYFAQRTEYRGITFRSKLESRWAVFFDKLNISWEYEPKTFEFVCETEKKKYIPDFLINDGKRKYFVEVKSEYTYYENENDVHLKISLLNHFCTIPLILLIGSPNYKNFKMIFYDNQEPLPIMFQEFPFLRKKIHLCDNPCLKYKENNIKMIEAHYMAYGSILENKSRTSFS